MRAVVVGRRDLEEDFQKSRRWSIGRGPATMLVRKASFRA